MLFVSTLAVFMASLDGNIVTVALPKISVDLSAGFSYLAWIVTGYLIALVALVILFGKMADVYGRKKIYILGFILFGATSALCGLSQNASELVVFRFLQGGSAALFFAVSRPILLENFPAKEISFAFGVNTATSSIGAVMGPLVGGLLVAIDWRLIFFVNVPIAIVASALALREVPRGVRKPGSESALKTFNPLSSVLFIIGISLIMAWLTFYDPIVGLLGIAVLVPFIVSEMKSKHPLVNRELVRNKGFVYSLLSVELLTIGYSGIIVAMTFYFQSVENYSPAYSGLLIVPISLTIGIGSVTAGRIYGRIRNPNRLAVIGALLCGGALFAVAIGIGAETSLWVLEPTLALIGLATGLYWIPLLTTAMKFPSPDIVGTTSGTFSMFVNMASALSITIAVALSAYFLPHSLATQVYSGGLVNLPLAEAKLFRMGIESAILVMGAFNIASVPLIYTVMKEQRRSKAQTDIIVSEETVKPQQEP
ncbi:MAG: MFS transporter [Thaumarchaeota archaeon]|nr:MFS transporter [Nitrososphaerota archaeon]